MQITRRVRKLVESNKNWDEDLKQDLYVQLLEAEEDPDLITKGNINQRYYHLAHNRRWVDNNRQRLIDDNIHAIRQGLGMKAVASPLDDELSTIEEVKERFSTLSPLLERTLVRVVLEGASPEEVAEEEEVSANTIYQRVWQAKKQIEGD